MKKVVLADDDNNYLSFMKEITKQREPLSTALLYAGTLTKEAA